MDPYPFDPANGPAVPDLPPISIGALAIGLDDLFGRAEGLVLPRTVLINETAQEFLLAFASDPDSLKVITSWAVRFGGVVESHICDAPGTPHRHTSVTFDYFGVQVDAYAFIPLPAQESQP
jgi:hypothetical protein